MSVTKLGIIPQSMRTRLESNRDGKLTVGQWRDMITEPLIPLFILMLPALLFVGRFGLVVRGLLIVGLIVAIGLVIPAFFRARRYARIPIHFVTLYANGYPPKWMFWKPTILYTDSGDTVKFHKRIAPRLSLEHDRAYLVYYIKDPKTRILLSIAPASHPDAEKWQPSESFERRKGIRD